MSRRSQFGALLFLFISTLTASILGQEVAAPPAASAAATPATGEVRCQDSAVRDGNRDVLPKFCRFALNYRQHLPDFVAQQTTTGHKTVWAEQVVFRQGREYYSNLTINGEPVKPDDPERLLKIPFLSAGEFGSLVDLFLTPDETAFQFMKAATLRSQSALVYEFHIPQAKNSFWTLGDALGSAIKPELRGKLWLDAATGHPLREELEAVHLPNSLLTRSVKTTTDYASMAIGDLGSYILPVNSETEVCERGLTSSAVSCRKNTLVFHDYQKFSTSTRVVEATQEP